MSSPDPVAKTHVVCVPSPAQSHISANLKLAKLLHWKGFHITFVNTEFNHRRILRARGGPTFLENLPSDFQFVTIPDGLPPSENNATQDIEDLCWSVRNLMRAPFVDLVGELNRRAEVERNYPPVSLILSDCLMTYSTIPAGEKFGIPVVNFWPISASCVMCFLKFPQLLEKGFLPLKDITSNSSEYLDTTVDMIPGMKNMRLRDFPTFIRNIAAEESIFNLVMDATKIADRATATIVHTFEALERDVLEALPSTLGKPVYAIGPFSRLYEQIPEHEKSRTKNIYSNLWKENTECLQWLDKSEVNSVLYINFGSIAFLTPDQAAELAMGIANSDKPFLWVIRPDLVSGEGAILPMEFNKKTKGRGFTAEWCPQEEVLNHPAIGGFLTHCGWNSTLESLSSGVPMLCWPSFSDQQTNCRLVCTKFESGIEINGMDRGVVEKLVRELMEGGKGKKMKGRAEEWMKLAQEAVGPSGSSTKELDRLIHQISLSK